MKSGIYLILNDITREFYIGSSINLQKRRNQHFSNLRLNKHNNRFFQNAYNKYKKFSFHIIEIVNDINMLIDREGYYINKLNPLYNLNKVTPSRLGSKASAETRAKLSKSHKGKSSLRKGIKTNKPAWNSGRTNIYSKTSLEKMSRSQKNRTIKGKPPKPDFTKSPYKEMLKPVICIELDQIFNSIADAARFTGNIHNQSNINAACRGKQKSAYGYTWKFKD